MNMRHGVAARIFLLCALSLACFLGSAPAIAQGWTEPIAPELWQQRLLIGPVAGLTTDWHQAPVRSAIPLGVTVQFRIQVPLNWSVRWTGASEIDRNIGWSTAEAKFSALGSHTVSYAADGPRSDDHFAETSTFDAVNTAVPATVGYDPVSVSALHLTADSVAIDPQNPNASSMDYFFRGSSIAALRQVGEGHYRTSTNRTLVLEAEVQPSGFAPLIEWRLDGKPQVKMGSPAHLEIYTPGPHTLSAGPLGNEKQIHLDAYMVHITSHQQSADDIPGGVPVTFKAETDPPGYESDITWIASTKYGSAKPWMGNGPEFTVEFDDALSAQGEWLGVRADNAKIGVDRKGEPTCQSCFDARRKSCEGGQTPETAGFCLAAAALQFQSCLAREAGFPTPQQTLSPTECPDPKPQFFVCESFSGVCLCIGDGDCERLKNSFQCQGGSFINVFGLFGLCLWNLEPKL
ncbi:MAG TPA: hypothetical protein VF173_11740 [Thermoanaerobaculia bacterium]|nr:hypothetical protein [Thermoanaerobaculia bacterium]